MTITFSFKYEIVFLFIRYKNNNQIIGKNNGNNQKSIP